jgi:hypothetical protein
MKKAVHRNHKLIIDLARKAAAEIIAGAPALNLTVQELEAHLIKEMYINPDADKFEIKAKCDADGIVISVNRLKRVNVIAQPNSIRLRPNSPIPGYQPSDYFRNLLNKGMK